MQYMIHACPDRMWYVEQFLVPSMLEQGISRSDITIWNDEEKKGNLWATMDSFNFCGKQDGGYWHLQDDVLLARDFAERTKVSGNDIECGFCHALFENRDGRSVDRVGRVEARYMWSSFPCIYIPNWILADFVEWFYKKALYRSEYVNFIHEKKHDDSFWRDYVNEERHYDTVINIAPALVDHIDWVIGGSVINQYRGTNCRAYHWEDEELLEELKDNLRQKGFGKRILF